MYINTLGDALEPTTACTESPEEFRAALEEARALRKTLVQQSQSIKEYLRMEIEPALEAIAQQVAANQEGTHHE